MDSNAPSYLKPTMIGGLALGAAGGLPLVGAINCACCALIVGGGFLAAWLYSQDCARAGVRFSPKDGAQVGLVAGLFYAVASTVVGRIASAVFPTDIDEIIGALDQFDLPEEQFDMAIRWIEGSATMTGVLLGFFVTLLLAAVFSTIGGLIGGSVFKVEPTPPAPPSSDLNPTS